MALCWYYCQQNFNNYKQLQLCEATKYWCLSSEALTVMLRQLIGKKNDPTLFWYYLLFLPAEGQQ